MPVLALLLALGCTWLRPGAVGAAPHPVTRHSPVWWANGAFPTAVPTRGVPDGPIGGNGDLGLTLGGVVVPGSAIGSPGAGASDNQNASLGALGMFLGKNDFWGWPRAVTYHASFQHFSPGYLLLGLSGDTGQPIALPTFTGSMSLEDGQLSATATANESGYSLLVDALVVSAQNTVLANVTANCPNSENNSGGGGGSVGLDLTLSSDTIFGMPLNTSIERSDSTLRLTKANVFDDGLSEPVMVPCVEDMIVYNSLRTFEVAADGALTVHNASGGPALCLSLQQQQHQQSRQEPGATGTGSNHKIVTVPCSGGAEAASQRWVLTGSQLRHTDAAGADWCVVAENISHDNTTTCPGGPQQSYYTDPSADGACQSTSFGLVVSPCAKRLSPGGQDIAASGNGSVANPAWTFDERTGFLAAGGSANGKCLGAIGPRQTNKLALTVKLHGTNGAIDAAGEPQAEVDSGGVVIKHRVQLQCGVPVQLTIGVATERDLSLHPQQTAAHGTKQYNPIIQYADELATVDSAQAAELQEQHATWWRTFWNASSVSLGEWTLIEKNYYTMMYLMASSMRPGAEGRVAPGLWGPFTITDFSGWSDQMTLDYNFEANYFSASTSNHPELVLSYAATIMNTQLVPLARERAALRDWSHGGWPDQFGAEVMGMSCGPTPDWDHDKGCAPGFGGFKGFAFVSCTGPFDGMACCFDDGTRFVAGLVATPLISYYDATLDPNFLRETLLPYLRGVADFYTSYSRPRNTSSSACNGCGNLGSAGIVYDIPFTCAQEICSPSGQLHNAHQDLAYARMAYTKLLNLTEPGSVHAKALLPLEHDEQSDDQAVTAQDRAEWLRMLHGLAMFPQQSSPYGNIFAEGVGVNSSMMPDPGADSGYPIAHFAAMHPAEVIDLASDPQLLDVARNTVQMENDGDRFAPGGAGFCLAWPAAAKVANRQMARATLENFTRAIPLVSGANNGTNNGWENDGGGGLEDIGATQAIHLMLLQTIDSALVLFPAWPTDSNDVSFTQLRAAGAFLVSAGWNHGQVLSPVRVTSMAGANLVIAKPWDKVCVHDSSGGRLVEGEVKDTKGRGLPDVDPLGRLTVKTEKGQSYALVKC